MEVQNTPLSVKQVVSSVNNNTILFDYPIQRGFEQWNHKQKSDLIHSCLIGLPIPAVYFLRFFEKRAGATKPVSVRWVLDGKQRITTLSAYYLDKFKLLPTYGAVNIEGVDYEVANKKFSELDEQVRDLLLSKSLLSYVIDQDKVTEEEIELLFYRMNASKPLTVHQKSKSLMGVQFSTLLNDVSNHSTVIELSNFPAGQIRDNKHQAAILQAMMLIEESDFKSFSANETHRYSSTVKNDFNNKIETLDKVEIALNYLNEVFGEQQKFLLKAVNFPMTVSLAYKAALNKIEPDLFYKWAENFKSEIEAGDAKYLEHTGSKSTDKVNVIGRKNEMEKHFNEFVAAQSFENEVNQTYQDEQVEQGEQSEQNELTEQENAVEQDEDEKKHQEEQDEVVQTKVDIEQVGEQVKS